MPAGLYSLTNLAVAILGTAMTSPFGPLALPADTVIDVSARARPGYVIQVQSGDETHLGAISSARPVPLDFSVLPVSFINAVIAAEDERFMEHSGVDPLGIIGAGLDTLRGDLRGGSTITQQMVKNTFVGNDRSFGRKVIEAMSAVRAHHEYGHQEILRRYLQSAWYGRGITGVMQAPILWFGKDWTEISLAESATLAAMLKGPSLYDPWRNPGITRMRRDAILDIMTKHGWITASDRDAAKAAPIRAIAPDRHDASNRWERRAAVDDLDARRSIPPAGKAQSTIDQGWQQIANRALSEAVWGVSEVVEPTHIPSDRLDRIRATSDDPVLPGDLRTGLPSGTPYNSALIFGYDEGGWDLLVAGEGLVKDVTLSNLHPGYEPEIGDLVPVMKSENTERQPGYEIHLPTKVEGAVVAIDPRSGQILASVGGVDAGLTEFDRTRALRQPGSSIKPFLYLSALSMGFEPDSPVEDIEYTWHSATGVPWHPRNYDHTQSGLIPMYSGLERSSNLAAAFLIDRIGVEAMAERAEAAGVYPEGGMKRHISAALGTSEVTLRDLVSGYGAIINDGMPRRPHAIEGIKDALGKTVSEDFRRPGPIAGREDIEDLLGMMRGVVLRGTASEAFRDHPVQIAGKTGTTQDWRDAWFVGVTPQLAIGVWLGRDDSKPLPNRMAGGSAAAPIAARILRDAFEAGMIDENGLRDESMSASLAWPPKLHQGGAVSERPLARRADPQPEVPGKQPQFGAADDGISGFWNGLEVQASSHAPDRNRNGDLIDLIR